MRRVQIAHREATNWSDWVALSTVRMFRWSMDFVTGYKHPKPGQKLPPKFEMNEQKWLARFVFLESIAGVPGMVGGMLRHLRSLRKMKRDNGWYVLTQLYCVCVSERKLTISTTGSKPFSKRPSTNACTS